jgi:ABC-type dipeptide/oligopeptide/nickel transport system permease subunit
MAQRAEQPDATVSQGVTADERKQLVPDLLARRFASDSRSYAQIVWDDFKKNRPAHVALWVMIGMALLGIFAPLIANQRPYFLKLAPEAILPGEGQVVSAGLQWPLFSLLRFADWLLMIGVVQCVIGMLVFRRARACKGVVRPVGALMLLLAGLAPIAAALLWSPALERALEGKDAGTPGWLGQPPWTWAVLGAVALLGAMVLFRAFFRLLLNRRDDFGRLMTGSQSAWAIVGSLLLLVPASWLGTLGQRALETTDYFAIAQREGATALFPPIEHDYLLSRSHGANQPPLGPFVRVQASGSSPAAADLGLADSRRGADLARERGAKSPEMTTEDGRVPLILETPLADLRNGQGVRRHESGSIDFTIISHNLDRYPVSLRDAVTISDVINAIIAASNGTVTAALSDDGGRIVLTDFSERRPIHLMGTDGSGSDVASRLIHATRVALSIGFVSTGIALSIGIFIGALMGYFGGWVDIAGMRTIEIFMAIPRLFLLLTIIAFIPPQWNDYMLYAMMAVLGLTGWMGAARFIRAEFMRLRGQDFVQAAQACGLPTRSVLFRHMLPNGVTPVLVDASFGVAAAIFIETGLSFLGFGIKPPAPSWGKMLSEAVDPSTGVFYWWLAIFPGIMIFLTVFAFNLIGDSLRDAIDPKLKKAAH